MPITVSVKALARREPLVPEWDVPWPPEELHHGEALTLRGLITRIVHSEVAAFRERQSQRRLVRVLSEREIELGTRRGKVDPGGRDLQQDVDVNDAVGTALQAFEDGLYLVIIDGTERRRLDEQVFVKPDSAVVFLRLVMLAGA